MTHMIQGYLTRFRPIGEMVAEAGGATEHNQGFWFLPWAVMDFDDLGSPPEAVSDEIVVSARRLAGRQECGFIMTCYFGGTGWQGAAVWRGDVTIMPWTTETTDRTPELSPISRACRHLGAVKAPADYDEFDAVGLGRVRNYFDRPSHNPSMN